MKKTVLLLSAVCIPYIVAIAQPLQGGASETTPSRSEYFTWINNTNEGATAGQTRINLDFFRWLHDTYGMELDLYAFDAGAIDGAKMYGNMTSDRFKRQFPEGFGPLSRQAAEMNTRLGLWCGPDGFGNSAAEEKARYDMMTDLVRKYNFGLFKMDGVCGQLRKEKYGAFDRMMTEIRKISPDFVLLNHRLNLGPGMRHSTTYLLGGDETYIDVHMTNTMTAPHHRGQAISRKSPENLTRLTEDHGVCLSSCLDYWEDDLILQAFGRDLILAPEIYGNPWLLRDDEYPYLAFIFNLHRTYRDILVHALRLPEEKYGVEALSRGDDGTRFITLRNLSWNPVTYKVRLGSEVGLKDCNRKVKARLYHPYVYDMGLHRYDDEIEVEVLPFRAALLKVTTQPEKDKVALSGIPYYIINDKVGDDVEIELLGMPGRSYNVKVEKGGRRFASSQIDGRTVGAPARGKTVKVSFPGTPFKENYHRCLSSMTPCAVPEDASSLYYATCYAADNNALEVRSLVRSGETRIPQVKAAREAFFGQTVFRARDLWDRYLFDGDEKTCFSVELRNGDRRVESASAFYLDLGEETTLDELIFKSPDEYAIAPYKSEEGARVYVSSDLVEWRPITFITGLNAVADMRSAGSFRYVRLRESPLRLSEVAGRRNGQAVDRTKWHACNLFRDYGRAGCSVRHAWKSAFVLNEFDKGAYLCIAVNGRHGREGVWAAMKMDGKYIGCPDRAPSFTSNTWEYRNLETDSNNTYYIPLTPDMLGKRLEVYALSFDSADLKPEVWITNYPIPFRKKTLKMIK